MSVAWAYQRDRRKRVLLRMKGVNRLRVVQGYMDRKIGIEEARCNIVFNWFDIDNNSKTVSA